MPGPSEYGATVHYRSAFPKTLSAPGTPTLKMGFEQGKHQLCGSGGDWHRFIVEEALVGRSIPTGPADGFTPGERQPNVGALNLDEVLGEQPSHDLLPDTPLQAIKGLGRV